MNTVTATAARRSELAAAVQQVFDDYHATYGCRRIARRLNELGVPCSVGLVADAMRELGLRAIQPRAYRVTTIHSDGDDYPPDLLDRDFTSTQPGTRLVGDITYLRTNQGWLYLATVIVACPLFSVRSDWESVGFGAGADVSVLAGGLVAKA